MDKENTNAEPALNLAYYVVLVTDVLGQGARLRDLKQLPQSEPEFQNAMQVLRDTCAFLVYWRGGFKNYFDLWGTPSDEAHPPGVKEFLQRACAPNLISYRHFSDSIIVAASLFDDGQQTTNPIMGVLGILLAAAGMHLLSICVGQPTRGGIDVGVAMPLPPENDIYGPALERAVYLEAEVAAYPRIAAGQELLQYLASVSEQLDQKPIISPLDLVAIKAADTCNRLLFRDTDGKLAVDYLGQEVHAQYLRNDPDLLVSVLPKAYRFVKAEQVRWGKKRNEKLTSRYERLWSYFRSRSHIWGAEIEQLAEALDQTDAAAFDHGHESAS